MRDRNKNSQPPTNCFLSFNTKVIRALKKFTDTMTIFLNQNE